MTQAERTRFLILAGLLIVLVIVGLLVNRFRGPGTEADILGIIQNQAAATYKSQDGLELSSLSDISSVTVSGGVANLTLVYKLEKRDDQGAKLDIQLFRPDDDSPLTTLRDKKGEQGSVFMKLKNIADGNYDITMKPAGFISQVSTKVPYRNSKRTTIDFKDPFLWGDLDKSHENKGDNKVNNADWAILISQWNIDSPDPKVDLNGDGVVNNVDASVLLKNWNKQGQRFLIEEVTEQVTPIPEF